MRSIEKIGKKPEVEIRFPIRQKPDLQLSRFPCAPPPALASIIGTTTSVASSGGIPDFEIEFGQRVRRKQRDHQRVDDLLRQLAEREQREGRLVPPE